MSGGPTTPTASSSIQSAALLEKLLRTDVISVTLKFGFQQKPFKYPLKDASSSIIEKIYRDAETWLRSIAINSKTLLMTERYTIYLFRIPTTDLTMVPIVQLSDIEQNSSIELVVVPVEVNLNPHALYRCQLNVPTNCSKCSRLITGIYRQGFRCRKCRMTYHKDCAPFSLDDCSVPIDPPSQTPISQPPQVTFVYPFDFASTSSTNLAAKSDNTSVPIYSPSSNTSKENEKSVVATTIIDEGIFPACISGTYIYRRYLFRLTPNALKLTTNLSTMSSLRQQTRQSTDIDIVFPLADINDLVLTHFIDERDYIFEIYFQGKFALCVGKKSDSDDLQMQTAQFYSSIRDQWEALANGSSSQPQLSTSISTTQISIPIVDKEKPNDLRRKQSIYRRPPCGKGNEDKDLHDLYTFTGEKIGEGQFGRVVGAIRKSTNRKVAIKCIEKANCSEEDIRRTNEEIDHLYKFNHVNILKLEAYFERGDAVYIITERMETDMCKYIMESSNKWLDENMSKMLIYQVIIALRYLHSNNCGHLDVKCENILISFLKPIPPNNNNNRSHQSIYKNDLPLVKLADFGYSRIIGEHSFRKTRVGTKVYCAPEIYRSKEGYNRLVDMWSVGIVLYAALTGTLPYDEKDVHRAEEIVRNKKLLFSHQRWKDITDEAIDLISNKLLVVQANTRIRSSEALFHAWFTDFHLYKKLREIENRTEYDFSTKHQQLPSSSTWLTGEREDSAWMEYKSMYEKSNEQ
ncbi:unnamed protein product [Rotaria sp. Silwood2]|nr:unnamed protein product [Rotaria sp. Silwood2]CAF3111733.1 unnamed protein product [Rotaria sp. Silwood2]CAF4259167.1 unnamed protein product [Rotaria sp. Silwood2]CAF4289371.1 unnamed protein product [Rotaria sp. Silwood2]CAF4323873.1 unnamed protein product [Rotaria sp. Silwood2]